jgi:hypothetical protein
VQPIMRRRLEQAAMMDCVEAQIHNWAGVLEAIALSLMMTHGRVETPLGLMVDYCLLGLGRFFFGPRLILPTFSPSGAEKCSS